MERDGLKCPLVYKISKSVQPCMCFKAGKEKKNANFKNKAWGAGVREYQYHIVGIGR